MTNDNKPPMFGTSGVFDLATYEPRSGKSGLMNQMVAELSGKPPALAETIIGNCTTSLPFKFEFDPKDNGHTIMFGTTREGMSGMLSGRDALPLFAQDVLLALGSMREEAETTGVPLATLSRLLGMQSSPEGDREILDALQQLGHLVPGLRFSESDRLVRAGDVHQ